MTKEGITVIVVSKGLEGLLHFCLTALQRALQRLMSGGEVHRVVVVDNASRPPYIQDLYRTLGVKLLRADLPLSFAAANNAAATLYPNDFYLLLNNDVLLTEETLLGMHKLMRDHPQVGLCGSRLIFPDGSIQHCGVLFGPGGIGPYHGFRKKPSDQVSRINREYQAVTGACLLVRRAVWEELGGLDESYPFGLEDIDLCLRARQRGWNVMCHNETESLHLEAMTPGRRALDIPSRKLFMKRWKGHYTLDG